jgi:hypothetical protein
MLRWSSNADGLQADLAAVAAGEGDGGLPHGAELIAFTEAIASGDDDAIATTRAQLVDAAGEAFMVDAAAVVANFEMMTRVADGTGARFPDEGADKRAQLAETVGITDLTSAR